MAKYLLLWEMDNTRTPEDLEERKTQYLGFQGIVRRQIKDGEISGWGIFVGEMKGFCIVDGSAEDVHKLVERWVPWALFQTKEVLSIEQLVKATEAM